jgi:hypothetical protein
MNMMLGKREGSTKKKKEETPRVRWDSSDIFLSVGGLFVWSWTVALSANGKR